MKKTIILLLILVLFASFFFGGCVIKSNDEKTSLVISDDSGKVGSIPNEIIVEAGNKFVFKLEANVTTGYTWIVDIEDEEHLSLVSNEYAIDDDEAVGSGGINTLTFSALKPGETTLKLTYAQDWDGGKTDKEKTIVITIK